MSTDLKPCPFCGGNPATNSYASRYRVNCANCYAAAWGLDTADAIAAWNRRKPGHIPDAILPTHPEAAQ